MVDEVEETRHNMMGIHFYASGEAFGKNLAKTRYNYGTGTLSTGEGPVGRESSFGAKKFGAL